MPEPAARSVAIAAGTDVVLRFLADVETLPYWASFYQRRLGREGDNIRFATPIGESLTHLETERSSNGGQVTIVSAFAERVERARLLVEPAVQGSTASSAKGSKVTFVITFPDHVPAERRAAMLTKLEGELGHLRTLLEQDMPAMRGARAEAVP
jgi:hypothetical protein